jgi:hypothetical protein
VFAAGFERGASVPRENLDDASALPEEIVKRTVVIDALIAGLHAVVSFRTQHICKRVALAVKPRLP